MGSGGEGRGKREGRGEEGRGRKGATERVATRIPLLCEGREWEGGWGGRGEARSVDYSLCVSLARTCTWTRLTLS